MKYSIRYKFIIGLLIISSLSYVFMSYFMSRLIMNNNKEIISKELLNSQKDVNIYLGQYFMLNKIEVNNSGFENHAPQISDALVSKLNSRITLFDSGGKKIYDSDLGTVNNKLTKLKAQDLSQYKMIDARGRRSAVFSQPLYIDNKILGYISYNLDYSDLIDSNNNLLKNMKIIMFVIFCIIFMLSFLFATKITIPIIKLNNSANEIAKGNFNESIEVKSKDEIGELANSFNIMQNTIKNQIDTIEMDRDNLIKLEGHRKAFFDNVTHEMKTPLTIISGYTQMIIDEEKDDKIIIRAARKAKVQSDRLHNMIISLIEKSKIESNIDNVKLEKLNVGEIINLVCDDMSLKARKYEMNIERYVEGDVYIFASREEVIRLLINIIDNSIKYGNVKSIIKVSVYKENEQCNIIVIDKGKGISNEDLHMIFEPFYKVDKYHSREKGSVGLGLAIVKSIVDKYSGTVNIESKVNIGTKVIIKIPLFTNWQQLD